MKIGIYTDVHCAFTSSILPLQIQNSKYTARLKMIVDTFRWMYDVFEEHSVDMIVNCGDLFDTFKLRAEEISAMAEALSFSRSVPEYHIVGNHELMDKRRNFYATALLKNYKYITVVDQPLKLHNGMSFLPYMRWEDAQDCLPLLSNDILFSHIDIEGSQVTPQFQLDTGIASQKLSDMFKLVINGHIHTYQKMRSNVYNIGASTSTSFSDDPNYHPSIGILDTDTLQFYKVNNPHAIRFERVLADNLDDIRNFCDSLDHLCALRCEISPLIKADANHLLESCENVVAFRLISNESEVTNASSDDVSLLELKTDVDKEFVNYLKSTDELKYPLADYLSVVNKLQEASN